MGELLEEYAETLTRVEHLKSSEAYKPIMTVNKLRLATGFPITNLL